MFLIKRLCGAGVLLLHASLVPTVPAYAQERCSGSTVVIGGALKDDNAEVWSRVVQLAGGAGSRIAVIATASANPQTAGQTLVSLLRKAGAQAEAVSVAANVAAGSTDADDPALAARLATFSGVYFSGGEQVRLLDALQPQGRETPLLTAIRALHCRGGVVAGSSAGAAVLSDIAFRDLPDPLQALKQPQRLAQDGAQVGRGFGFVPAGVIVDQHFVQRGRIGRLLPLMLARGVPLGLGVEENSAAVVRGMQVEVIGARGVLLVDTTAARQDAAAGAFNASGVRLAWLESGDGVDLATRQPRIAADRRTQPAPAQRTGRYFHADMLGSQTLVSALTQLALGSRAEAVGLAWTALPGPADPHPQLAFEWTLSAGPDTRAHVNRAGDSVTNVMLSVRPVRLADPLYGPWSAAVPLKQP